MMIKTAERTTHQSAHHVNDSLYLHPIRIRSEYATGRRIMLGKQVQQLEVAGRTTHPSACEY
jgi:hypothetical protein